METKIAAATLNVKYGLITGLSLLLMALLAGIGYGYAFEQIQTWSVSPEMEWLMEEVNSLILLFLFCFAGIFLLDVLLAWTLYRLFSPFTSAYSQLLGWTRLIYSVMLAISLLHVLELLDISQLNLDRAFVQSTLDRFLHFWSFSLILFGVHLLLLGLAMKKSKRIPNLLSYMMLLAGFCYLVFHLSDVFIPLFQPYKASIEMILAVPMALGELAFAIYLVWFAIKNRISTNSK